MSQGPDELNPLMMNCPHDIATTDTCEACRDGRIGDLEASRPTLVAYLKMKLEAEDWHGVQDAASDLRDVDSELDGLRY